MLSDYTTQRSIALLHVVAIMKVIVNIGLAVFVFCVFRESSGFEKIQTKSVYGERSISAMQASNRGKAFGALYLTGSLGGMFGSLYATNLGKSHVFYNMLNATTLACRCICQLSVLG